MYFDPNKLSADFIEKRQRQMDEEMALQRELYKFVDKINDNDLQNGIQKKNTLDDLESKKAFHARAFV